ncbi:MAG: hypothetical protein KDK40_01740 [Chlamydiia bacterium]|nr:hypothetical protein [Chlamydiia bacterium]
MLKMRILGLTTAAALFIAPLHFSAMTRSPYPCKQQKKKCCQVSWCKIAAFAALAAITTAIVIIEKDQNRHKPQRVVLVT